MNKRLTFLAATAVAAVAGTSALAVPLDMRNIGFLWSNPQGGANYDYLGQGTSSADIRWGGAGDTFAEKSGYNVTAAGNPVPNPGVDIDTPFILGSFTHYNEPIPAGTAIDSVDLLVLAQVYDNDAFVDTVGFIFEFEHLETDNSTPCDETPNPIGTECDDQVTVSLVDFVDTFTIGTVEYTLTINGFLQGDQPLSQFWSGEGNSQTADVQATFTAAEIPLPAAGFMLLGALGGLGFASRRRKKS